MTSLLCCWPEHLNSFHLFKEFLKHTLRAKGEPNLTSATQIHQRSLAAALWTKAIPMLTAVRLSCFRSPKNCLLAEAPAVHICKAPGPLSPTWAAEYNAAVRMWPPIWISQEETSFGRKQSSTTFHVKRLVNVAIFGCWLHQWWLLLIIPREVKSSSTSPRGGEMSLMTDLIGK